MRCVLFFKLRCKINKYLGSFLILFLIFQEIYCSGCYNKRFSNSLKPEQNDSEITIPIIVDVQPDDCIRCKKKVRIIKIILNKTFAIISVFNPQRFFLSNLQMGPVFVLGI